MTDKDPEELLEQTKNQRRHTSEPRSTDTESEPADLESAIQDAFESIESGDLPENLSVRDENLAALFAGLDETGRLEDVINSAHGILGREPPEKISKTATLKALIRLGLQECEPDVVDTTISARQAHLAEQASNF